MKTKVWEKHFYYVQYIFILLFSSSSVPLSDSDVCESAASEPACAAPRSPTEAARPAAQAAGGAGGAGAQDEGAADGKRGQAVWAGKHEEGKDKIFLY